MCLWKKTKKKKSDKAKPIDSTAANNNKKETPNVAVGPIQPCEKVVPRPIPSVATARAIQSTISTNTITNKTIDENAVDKKKSVKEKSKKSKKSIKSKKSKKSIKSIKEKPEEAGMDIEVAPPQNLVCTRVLGPPKGAKDPDYQTIEPGEMEISFPSYKIFSTDNPEPPVQPIQTAQKADKMEECPPSSKPLA